MKRVLVLIACLLTACQQAKIEPVDIAGDDMCSHCRMAISEMRFAAEFLDGDGAVFKFDDAGCMLNYIRGRIRREDIRAIFVMDYEARRWLKADDAVYVRSERIKTPMGGGIIAFADKGQAEAAAGRYQGKLLKFDGLF